MKEERKKPRREKEKEIKKTNERGRMKERKENK